MTTTMTEPPPAPEGPRTPAITRRALLRSGAAAGGALAIGGAGYGISRLLGGGRLPLLASRRVSAGTDGAARRFHSRPDLLPATTTVTGGPGTPGYLLVGPAAVGGSTAGPLIADGDGEPVWFAPVATGRWLTNFSVQSYRGAPVLTWWEGTVVSGYGAGEAVIADTSYREIARIRAANGRQMDLHELLLTDAGTALFTCAPQKVATDLTAIGGARDADTLESIFQEIDVASGRLVSEWRSLQHVAVAESYRTPSATFDYLHLNSIDVLPDGNLLVSARHTWALYKLDRRRGDVIWRLGGKRSQFALGDQTQFAWQHDGRLVDAGRLTVFDDGNDGVTKTHPQSRGLMLNLDEAGRRVTLGHSYTHPSALSATAMGSTRVLAGGHVVVGWGAEPDVTEFAADGTVVADLRMAKTQKSYRGFRAPWSGSPSDAPATAAVRDRTSHVATLYVSWNGATAATRWRVYAGTRRSDLRALGIVPKRGFETAINLGTGEGYAAVAALDAQGRELRHSGVIAV